MEEYYKQLEADSRGHENIIEYERREDNIREDKRREDQVRREETRRGDKGR